jgi:hypothetical protein
MIGRKLTELGNKDLVSLGNSCDPREDDKN